MIDSRIYPAPFVMTIEGIAIAKGDFALLDI